MTKGIGLKLSTLLSPLSARTSNSVRPPWSDDDDDDDDSDSNNYERSIRKKKKIVLTRSDNRKGRIGSNRKKKNKKKQRYYSDESSYYSNSGASLSALSEEDDDSLEAYTSESDSGGEYASPRSRRRGEHRHRHRRQHRQQGDRDKRRRRKRREEWSSSSSSGSVQSEYIGDNGDYVLTRGELNELSTKTLRKRCHRAGIDANKAMDKGDLVEALCDHYRSSRKSKSNPATVRGVADGTNRGRRKHREMTEGGRGLDDETTQMIEILQEIIPFYGQGDHQSDAIVRDTIERLPEHALELPDATGNTILLLACQSGAYDLVPLLLSRGSDAGAQNNDGVASLHYACYTDSFSPEMAELLVDNGATADVFENQYGCSPLHWAAFAGHTDLCNLLCHAGGNPRTVDKNGCDAVEYARQSGNEDCSQFLLSLADPRAGAAASAASTHTASVEQAANNNEGGAWEEHIDDQSGRKYFRNTSTEQALWENEYKELTLHAPAAPKDEQSITVGGDNKMDENHLLTAPIPDSAKIMPPSPIIANETNNIMSSNTFEERMVALQSKMEKQFLQQLSKIEGRISEQQQQPMEQQQQQQHTSATASSESPSESLIEMTSKVVQLQADIGGKDLEILSLKRDVSSLEAKLAMGIEQQQQRPSIQTRDASVGDGNILLELHRESSSSHETKIDIATVRDELEMTSRRLKLAQEQSLELETQLRLSKQELLAAQDKQALAEQQVATAEDMLAKERLAKDDILRLLEQTKQGAQVGEEISQSMKGEKVRDKETIARLELNLKSMELVKADEIAVFQSQLDHKEKKLVDESLKITRLNEEMEDMRRSITSERDRLDVAQREHSTELQQLRDAGINERAKLEEELAKSYGADKEELQRQLNEERLSRMEKEVERNDAIESKEDAVKRMVAAEARLEEVNEFIAKAKELTGANERLHRALQDETEKRKTLHNKLEDLKGRIRVYVRIRPLSASEEERQCQSALIKEDKRTCVMNADPDKGTGDPKSWEFDQVFCGSSDSGNGQEDIFRDTCLLITSAVDGFNVCLFAYGQTGSGKSYTMFGPGAVSYNTLNGDSGLAPRAAEELFRVLQEKEASCHIDVQVCMFELYNDSLRDLLVSSRGEEGSPGGKTLKIKLAKHSETGMVEVDGATKESVTDASELLSLFERGSQGRATASTSMNADSSRSHLIASIVTTLTNRRTGKQLRGKLTLCDLAGSERVSKSGATGDQLKEAQSINKSLSALGDVISALTSGSRHIPYRNHPLTKLMSDSLGGSAKTVLFLCCSPADYNRSESINSLDFARRCKNVTNNVSGGSGSGDQALQIRKLQTTITRMKKEGKTVKPNRKVGRPGY